MDKKTYKLELTEEQINYILNVVAQRPFVECNALLAEIQSQASSQLDLEPKMEVIEE